MATKERTQVCAHYWVIESPCGPVSRGKCSICGEEREFINSLDSEDDPDISQGRRRGRGRNEARCAER